MTDSMSVSELNEYAKRLLENDILLQMVNVSGEISNYKRHQSGHIYFTLKDERSKINCSFFKNYNCRLKFEPKDGMLVTVSATASVYVRDGAYQLYVYGMSERGAGRLYEQFEKLKGKLNAEGLFDEAHKKTIPPYPKRIAVLTSPTGAAVRDIISVTGRRAKNTEIIVVPVPVQGEGAAKQIAKALYYADNTLEADTIIIARGGGSIEELWAFNDEELARAVYNCKTPVISGVGHETDFTICDFAADMRAATPSAAAEIAVRDCNDIMYDAARLMRDTAVSLEYRLRELKNRAQHIMNSAELSSVAHSIRIFGQRADTVFDKITQQIEHRTDELKKRCDVCMSTIEALDPYRVLSRGYAIASTESGTRIYGINGLAEGDRINIEFSDGTAECTVEKLFGERKQ